MAYTKTEWKDRIVQYARRFTKSGETSTEVTLTPSPGTVTEAGTAIAADKLNKIEQGIADAHADGHATDKLIGDRTISDATAPNGNAGKLTTLLGFLAYMVKSITGKTSWRTAPVKSLEELNDEKAPKTSPTFSGNVSLPSTTSIGLITSTIIGYLSGLTSNIQQQLNEKAPRDSPSLTGTPITTTPGASDNSTRIASTAFTQTVAANARPYVSGTYTGNGAASRIISLPFTPSAVLSMTQSGNMKLIGGSTYGGLATTGVPAGDGAGYEVLTITTNGFNVVMDSARSVASNANLQVYNYIAFK